jgi:hypothetical protein
MPDYDFQSLSSFDFQSLSRDLIQKHLGIILESFGPGRDKGVDFRLQDSSGSVVVQCKHYKDYEPLLRVLKKSELEKVKKLNAQRYILSVSTSLTPNRKDEIFEIFVPHCQSRSDIFGREDLNNLLAIFPEVERRNVKLWLTNTAVLEHFINVAVWKDTALTLKRLQQKARLYVPNLSRGRARNVLDQHHYCIIAGIPGIGKTTLAEVLLIEYVNKFGYEAVRIANDLSEIKGVKDPARKQIFYFDDFLGTTALDRIQKNEDKRLLEFLTEVKSNDNWRFVLTTREYILNAAKLKYESLAQPMIDLTPCIIELADYTFRIRAKILYNHIYFSELADPYKRSLLEDQRYEKIINHQNYNPRIVEYMTSAQNVRSIPVGKYFQHFLDNLANPTMVWDHAFRNQLSEAGQHLILVMGSLGEEVRLQDLEAAFRSFYDFRRLKLGFQTGSRDFENAVKELDGNFIKTGLVGAQRVVTLHNPSLSDFLEFYFLNNSPVLMDIIDSAVFFDQFMHLWRGRRGKRYAALEGLGGEKLLQALRSKLALPLSTLRRIKADERGPDTGVSVKLMSLEERVGFVIEVHEIVNTPKSSELKNELLDRLRVLLLSKRGSKRDLVLLLRRLSKSGEGESVPKGLLQAAKSYLLDLTAEDDLDDFEVLSDFIAAFRGSVNTEELDVARRNFEDFCQGYDDSWADSPDDLRHDSDRVSIVSSILDADVGDLSSDLEKRASEWEESLPQPEEDRDDYDDDEGWDRPTSPADEAREMFEELLDEYRESDS